MNARRALVWASACALVCGVFAVRATGDVNPYDDPLPLVCAERILAGDVPYRDFHTHYPPLLSLLEAAPIALGLRSFLVARLVLAAVSGAACGLAGGVASRLARDRSLEVGAVVTVVAALVLEPTSGGATVLLGAALVLGALLAALHERAALAGALVGLAATACHDLAVLAAVPIALTARGSGRFVVAASVAPLALVSALALDGALGSAWRDLAGFSRDYALARRVPWPAPDALGSWSAVLDFYGPAVVAVLGLAARERGAAPLIALALLGYEPGLVRSDVQHVALARLAALALAGVLASRPRRALVPVLAVSALLVLPSLAREVPRTLALLTADHVREGTRRGLVASRGLDPDRRRVLELLAARPPAPGSGSGSCATTGSGGNDVALYFDAGALPATRFHELTPWCARDTFPREMVADLERAPPSRIVLENLPVPLEPNESAVVHGSRALDAFIARRYAVQEIVGGYVVLAPGPG